MLNWSWHGCLVNSLKGYKIILFNATITVLWFSNKTNRRISFTVSKTPHWLNSKANCGFKRQFKTNNRTAAEKKIDVCETFFRGVFPIYVLFTHEVWVTKKGKIFSECLSCSKVDLIWTFWLVSSGVMGFPVCLHDSYLIEEITSY